MLEVCHRDQIEKDCKKTSLIAAKFPSLLSSFPNHYLLVDLVWSSLKNEI